MNRRILGGELRSMGEQDHGTSTYDRSAFFPQQDVNFCFIINFINLGEQQIFGGDCIFAGEPQSIESSLPRAVLIGGGPWPLCAMTCGHLVTGTNIMVTSLGRTGKWRCTLGCK